MHQLHIETEEAVDVGLSPLMLKSRVEQDTSRFFQEAKQVANASNLFVLA